jgi:lysozyme
VLFWAFLILIGWYVGARYDAPPLLLEVGDRAVRLTQNAMGAGDGETDEAVDDVDDARPEESDDAADAQEATTLSRAVVPQPPAGGIPENQSLRINEAGLQIIKDSEGLRLEAYSGVGGQYIGYGHRMNPGDQSTITAAEADALLREDVRTAEDGVRERLTHPANENEFSAMVSLAYNLGVGGFSRSPVLERFNAGDKQGAADAFLTHNRGGGQVLEHLTQRREKERALFLTPV